MGFLYQLGLIILGILQAPAIYDRKVYMKL